MDAVIVTGAAGALGHAVVEEFLAGGRAVVALDRPSERLDAMGERENVHAIYRTLDARAGRGEATVTRSPTDDDGVSWGDPIINTGSLRYL